MANSEFVGRLMTFDDDDEIENKSVLCEVTEFNADGSVEVAFNDRNERCYLAFRLQDLIEHIAALSGHKK